uniref:ShKT domain-containing protein n=1 Tax=Heterorhabditis bacteriophora TaxID=37862 RepID=A0A1I7XPJ1_HETBA
MSANCQLACGTCMAPPATAGLMKYRFQSLTKPKPFHFFFPSFSVIPTLFYFQLKPDGVDCNKNLCYHLMYRTLDGTCNNLDKPMQGAAFRQYIRHFPSEYDDNKGEPVSSITNIRPSARESNRVMLSSAQSVTHDKVRFRQYASKFNTISKRHFQYNNLMMQWGQFMSHDMAKTTLQPSAQCTSCTPVPSKCMPIPIAPKDPNAAIMLLNNLIILSHSTKGILNILCKCRKLIII